MSYATDLLALAQTPPLTATDAERRRCISTAYYAVFHLIVETAVCRFNPTGDLCAGNLARRVLTHTNLKSVAGALVPQAGQKSTPLPKAWKEAQYAGPVPDAMAQFASLVVDLHAWRETADYDLGSAVTSLDVQNQVDKANDAFIRLKNGLPEPECLLFLMSIMMPSRRG